MGSCASTRTTPCPFATRESPPLEARLMRKGGEAKLSFIGHALMENGNGLLMDFLVSRATGRAEREAVPVMLDDARQRGYRPRTLGADKGYDTRECVRAPCAIVG